MKCDEITSLVNDADDSVRASLCEKIFKEIDERGLGTLTKTDLETLIFHSIVDSLEDYDEYELMRIFKVSPTKLRSLRLNESVKYFTLDIESKDNLIKILDVFNHATFETISSEKDKVRFYISDVHSYRLMEKYLRVKTNSSPDYQLNPHQMDIKVSCLRIVAEKLVESIQCMMPNKGIDLKGKIVKDVRGDTSYSELQSMKISVLGSLEKLKNDALDQGFSVAFDEVVKGLLKIGKHKLFGND